MRVIIGDDAFYNEAYSIKRLYAENKENPVAISDKAAGEEVVANFVGSLIHDKAHLSKLVYKLSHPVLSSIRDAFSEFLNYFRRGGLSYDAAMAKGALRIIDRAFADVATNKFPFDIEEGTKYSLIVDQNEIDRLNKEKVEIGYQNIDLKDDLSIGAPMASKLKNTGKGKIATGDSQFGRWGVSEENPDLVDENGKIDLVKPDGKTVGNVDYNPYFHIRPYLFNKQFKQAWERPKLVFIETEFPASELSSGFKADKAKLPVGRHHWNGGDLILSRWTRPKAIVPWREVAPHWIEEFKDSGVHFDNVPPALLNVLRDNGVKILPPHKGMGASCFEAYESFKKGNYNPEFITDEQIDAFNENIRAKRAESEDYIQNKYSLREDNAEIDEIVAKAKANGTYMKAPNGKPSKLIPHQWAQVRTKSFKNWFGDWEKYPNESSKVVDENGEPMVVYHGRSEKFNIFEKRKGSRFVAGIELGVTSEGYFFTDNEDLAHSFANNSTEIRGGKANVLSCFINLRNPLDLVSNNFEDRYEEATGWEYNPYMDSIDNMWEMMDVEGISGILKRKGYDGVLFVEKLDKNRNVKETSICVLEPTQIKSATDNVGTFDENNPDIRYSLREDDAKYQIIGEKGASALDKAQEATYRIDNLSVARQMEEAGKDEKTIRLATGWERGADGKWRYEIMDGKFKKNPNLKEHRDEDSGEIIGYTTKLGELLDNEELFKAYPQLRELRITFQKIGYKEAYFRNNSIHLDLKCLESNEIKQKVLELENSEAFKKWYGVKNNTYSTEEEKDKAWDELEETEVYKEWDKLTEHNYSDIIGKKDLSFIESEKGVLLHEIQHAIQKNEAFSSGGNINRIKDVLVVSKKIREKVEDLLSDFGFDEWIKYADGESIKSSYIPGRNFNLGYAFAENVSGITSVERKKLISYLDKANLLLSENNKLFRPELRPFEVYERLAGEVESRNVEARMNMSEQERRETLLADTEDVSRKDQIFLFNNLGESQMGSRVDKRMAEVGEYFERKELSDNERAVVDVFSGKSDNKAITVERDGKQHKVVMRQGNENKAGTKHSLFRHYGTNSGVISSEDLLLIPEVIERGEKEVKGKGIAYKLKKDGVSYIVYNEIHKNQEQFCDFYTNRKGSSTHPSNTQLSAQVDSATTNSDTKVVENFENPTIESKKSALSADGDKYSLRKGGKEYRNNGYTQRDKFSVRANDELEKKSLVGIHNLTDDNLRYAIKLGGLANPSTAVVDTDIMGLEEFGDISMIMPKSLVDKRTGKNVGTYAGDAYTPRFPNGDIVKHISSKGEKKINQDYQGNDRFSRDFREAWHNYGNEYGGITPTLYYLYKLENGGAKIIKAEEPKIKSKAHQRMIDKFGNKEWYELNDAEKQELVDYRRSEIIESLKGADKNMVDKVVKDFIDSADQENLAYKKLRMLKIEYNEQQRAGEVDYMATYRNAQDDVALNGEQADFNKWLADKSSRYGIEDRIFLGYTPSGNRKYAPMTLANISKVMKEQGRAGAEIFMTQSPHSLRGKMLPVYKTLEQIKKNKSKLVDTETYEKFRNEISDEYNELILDISKLPNVKYDDTHYILEDALLKGFDYAEKQADVQISDAVRERISAFGNLLKEAPVKYFETKFERPVMLNEFVAAVVPKDIDAELKNALIDNGIAIEEYERGNEESRLYAIKRASNREDVKFSLRDDGSMIEGVSEREAELRDAVADKMRQAGVNVVTDNAVAQRVLDMENVARLSRRKRRALETVSVISKETHQPTVVSSADGANVLKKLDSTIEKYDNLSNRSNTFIGDVASAIGATNHGSQSQYVTFETVNGKVVTIRISNHNATVSNFDNYGETEGISIVVSAKKNEGITNDGSAHIVEYFYDAIKLRRAEGKPLADIVRSIKQALYSGEFKDRTGLAERQEVNENDVARFNKVFHGSGAEFDAFDFSHMGEGEGVQAFGWGGYVTETEGIGRRYASISSPVASLNRTRLEMEIRRAEERLPFSRGYVKTELANQRDGSFGRSAFLVQLFVSLCDGNKWL